MPQKLKSKAKLAQVRKIFSVETELLFVHFLRLLNFYILKQSFQKFVVISRYNDN